MKGQTGASLGGGIRYGTKRAKRMRQARKREEARWAAKAGPVTITFDPAIVNDVRPRT